MQEERLEAEIVQEALWKVAKLSWLREVAKCAISTKQVSIRLACAAVGTIDRKDFQIRAKTYIESLKNTNTEYGNPVLVV